MPYVITGFALVTVALLAVVVALIDLTNRYRTLRGTCSQLLARLQGAEKSWKQSESAAVLAAVAALEGVVGKLAKSVRSQFGTLHAKVHALETPAEADPPSNGERPTRDQLRALYLKVPQVAKDD